MATDMSNLISSSFFSICIAFGEDEKNWKIVNKAVTANLSYLIENKCGGLEAYLLIF
jgi:hypothetical protein